MRTAMALVVAACVAACSSWALAQTRHPGHEVIWSQPPTGGGGLASQFAPDFPFHAECADDFVPAEGGAIVHAHWWGTGGIAKSMAPVIAVSEVTWAGVPVRDTLDCSQAILSGCGVDSIVGNNSSGQSNVDSYSCWSWFESGPEIVYALRIAFPGTEMTATLSGMSADLDIWLLSECDPNTCIAYGNVAFAYTFPEPGTYYLVVDGYYGAVSDYKLSIACPGIPDKYFTIRFYGEDAARDGAPPLPQPGGLLYEYSTYDFHEQYEPGLSNYSYWADIPPFQVVAGSRYWVSVQMVMNFLPYGQWFWYRTGDEFEHSGVMDFEYIGLPRWTPLTDIGYRDLAFELSTIDSPVERVRWGTIKGMYR